MKILRLWTLLLVPIFSAQAFAQIDTLTVENDSADTEYMQEEETDDNALRVQVKGFLDTYHAVRTEGRNDWMASRTRARGEVKLEKGAASLFVSMNATYNGVLKDRTGLELREAYLAYTKGNLDLRVGRQIVVWGVADALRVTDCVSPFDYTEFLAQDYDDIRMPVNALHARYTWHSVTFEAICNPVADFFILPTDRCNPWALTLPSAPLPYTIDLESGKPEKRLRNMEYGGRITTNLSGIDFSLSALRTWNKMPALSLAVSDDGKSLLAKGEYRRMTMLGADCSLPVGQIVLRGEAACYFDEAQSRGVGKDVVCRNTYNILAGVDWYPGNDWNFSAQYCHKYTAGNLDGLSVYRNAGLATARISKELLRNMLKLSTFAYIDVTNGGVFNRFSASYALNDQIELTAGYDYFHADKGKFQMYDRNSEIWAKMKYSF
ncbi:MULTISPECIES: DUF1302 family protein [Prevotellaceae]|uniref:Porin n=1 Tax=Hoylesella enoeca TaxID=76123 RepID=A0A0S2KKU4_9BACT|nr:MULTISPECIES: DUF1302 family protein [Prevotellaceae]ALO48594.1 hypothetical protein AS203_05455 [Hoylesella enoeca]KGF40006.1 hypothetical protein HMPREF2139_08450 [Prevotella denticola DNF00960]